MYRIPLALSVSRYFHAHDQRITSITQAASAHQ
jgi:hypothetical protein